MFRVTASRSLLTGGARSPAPAIFLFCFVARGRAGDKEVQTAQGTYMVYVHAGTNPFDTITQAVK